ncbi:MAG TPA: hypothetical protein P5316_21890 [Phycisphaerae bacterium]|jgi:hypothetical protein|nr:hypothetical protein [Phycisphaerae bacterium]
MREIHKKVITDDQMRPVAVQIDYADWVEIERQLAERQLPVADAGPTDLSSFAGTLRWSEDGVAYQRRVREEWDR